MGKIFKEMTPNEKPFVFGIFLLFAGAFATIFLNATTGKFDPIPFDIGIVGCGVLWSIGIYRRWRT